MSKDHLDKEKLEETDNIEKRLGVGWTFTYFINPSFKIIGVNPEPGRLQFLLPPGKGTVGYSFFYTTASAFQSPSPY